MEVATLSGLMVVPPGTPALRVQHPRYLRDEIVEGRVHDFRSPPEWPMHPAHG